MPMLEFEPARTQRLFRSEAVLPLEVAPKMLEGTESSQTWEERENCAVADLHV